MRTHAFARHGKRAAARLRAIRRRAADWQRRLRRATALALIAAGSAAAAPLAHAQMGQMGMAPAGGVVNRAVAGFKELNANGPGWLYYGINAADRGLGYNGSYMTLGAFVPYSQDDLGGLWALDARNHVSEYGGYFGNFGLVRKQFLGGSLLGVGVYYDYDGDANQYSIDGLCGVEPLGTFGHVYHQVGVSAEWLTDFGNLRSNGYMPVGTTAYTAGAPGSAFYQNYVMCDYGLDAALSGADLEVGVYVPGLSDWAGMISVGGYALGNARYDWDQGPLDGEDVVPWFGGVYTRLDMTFLENWDFSLQANNDSYFDWTGFARLTYRMGGSRRRNVPDQMEQPMMRNEHIVRAHQTPEVALNPSTGTPWRVIHIDNTAAPGGNGTNARPFDSFSAADRPDAAGGLASAPGTIFFVHRGDGTAAGYDTQFTFLAPNQSLIGDGGPLYIPTVCCGDINIATNTGGQFPLLSNPGGTSVLIDGAQGHSATVANLQITGSQLGIEGTGDLGNSRVTNVAISGNGTTAPQTGISISKATAGRIEFTDTSVTNMTTAGLLVEQSSAEVSFQGSLVSDVATNGGAVAPIVYLADNVGAKIDIAAGGTPTGSTVPNQVSDTGGQGIRILGNDSDTNIRIGNVSLKENQYAAIAVANGDESITTVTADSGSGIFKTTPGAAIAVENSAPTFRYDGPITNTPAVPSPPSYLLSVANNSGGSVKIYGDLNDTGDGILIVNNTDTNIDVDGATIDGRGAQGILIVNNSGTGTFEFFNTTITGASSAGVLIQTTACLTEFSNLNIELDSPTATGFQAVDSGPINSYFNNNISTASTTAPAVSIVNSGEIFMDFNTVSSAVPPGTNAAMNFTDSFGTFSVLSQFLVSGSSGTVAGDVTPVPPNVTVTVPTAP
ncbi:MAG: hypothetical protein ACKO40_11520 [Planctomycetaceae bacterium]